MAHHFKNWWLIKSLYKEKKGHINIHNFKGTYFSKTATK